MTLSEQTQAAAEEYGREHSTYGSGLIFQKTYLAGATSSPLLERAIVAMKKSYTLCEGDLAVINHAYLEKSMRLSMEILDNAIIEIEAAKKEGCA